MADAILLFAIPGFLGLMLLELAVTRAGQKQEARLLGYHRVDSRTSLAMGLGSLVVNGAWRLMEVVILGVAAALVPWSLGHGWTAWAVGLIGIDFCYYWDHRAGHEIRLLWASHVVHHSSQRYNLSTALRQTWTGEYTVLFFLPVALLGVPVQIVLACWSINLLYQFWIHTEAIDKLWRPVELVFNTPSHHRVHHGSQSQYLDRNYAGVLIVWDRLFGTFEPEGEPVVYGLTKNLRTYNPLKVATHEYVALWRDLRTASSWRNRAGHLLRGPGWAPTPVAASEMITV
ncbi:MAG: fatty acid hydroxylase [Frankiales bacterium]|jgi:sterol desaturase/sphingolipid hydroxylase (fatty acid hydroxylase superfamily)|nr:fatty acid hydroxylase [Frankiales bacterium]